MKTEQQLIEDYYDIFTSQLELYALNVELIRDRLSAELKFFFDKENDASSRIDKRDSVKNTLLSLGKLAKAIQRLDLESMDNPLELIFHALEMLVWGWQDGEGRAQVMFTTGELSQGWFLSLEKGQRLLADVLRLEAATLRSQHVNKER